MVTKHVFWGKYFGKSVFGHFFCPISIFPKNFPSKNLIFWVFKYFNYIISKIYLKRRNLSVQTASFKYYRGGLVRINIGGRSSVFKVPTTVSECLRGNANRCIASANTKTEFAYIRRLVLTCEPKFIMLSVNQYVFCVSFRQL
jgi:hypothetical protein